jgi:hypothetical protein
LHNRDQQYTGVLFVIMYRKQGQNPISPENFEFAFSGKLSSDNRWVVLASLIPWAEFEDEYNESGDLKSQVEAFKNFTGYYPESVHVDKTYRTRENRAWCKERGIRISGSPLGRPPANVSKEKKKQYQMKGFVILLRESLDKLKEDLAWVE